MKITAPQNRRIHQLLYMTTETAWKQDWVAEASNYRVYSAAELTVDEAAVLINMLTGVLNGSTKPKNPASSKPKDIDFLGKPLSNYNTNVPASPFETENEKRQRLRRKILKCCHEMEWYQRNAITGTIALDANGKPKLDYTRIDAYCIKYSAARKILNYHSSAELEGKGGLIFQFQTMAKNYTNGQKKGQ